MSHPSDGDLIRRGDALAAIRDAFNKGRDGRGGIHCAIVQVPAIQVPAQCPECGNPPHVGPCIYDPELSTDVKELVEQLQIIGAAPNHPGMYDGKNLTDWSRAEITIYGTRAQAAAWLILNGTAAADTIEAQQARIGELTDDASRLDWLDEMNRRKNEHHGTRYGWRYEANHNRIALSDHHFPVKTVREAIDEARARNAPTRCKWCNDGCGWYTSNCGGFARWVPCDHCNSDGTQKPDPRARSTLTPEQEQG